MSTVGQGRRVTLRDVAKRAGVSPTAASFVLSDRDDQRISEGTKERVRAAAAELDYRPNLTARTLRTGTSGTIALVSEFLSTTPYAGAALKGALETARQHGALLYIAETLGETDIEHELLRGLLDRRVDGFVYAAMFTHTVRIPELLRDAPLVLLNCVTNDVEVPMVVPDEIESGAAAARELLEAGHREGIHFIGALPSGKRGGSQWKGRAALALTDRIKGVKAELRRHGCGLASSPAVTDWEPEDGRRAVADLLAHGGKPRALICANDRLAFGAYQALGDAKLAIPDDVSVVSFDHSEIAGWLHPTLTSLALPHAEMGRLAVEQILSAERTRGRLKVPMPLHRGGSVASPG